MIRLGPLALLVLLVSVANATPPDSVTLRRSDPLVISWGKVANFFGMNLTDPCPRQHFWRRDSTVVGGWALEDTLGIPTPVHPRAWGDRWSDGLVVDSLFVPWGDLPDSARDQWLEAAIGSAIGLLPLPPVEEDSVPTPPDSLPPIPGNLLHASDFRLGGAFRGPSTSCPNCLAWGGGAALGYDPEGDAGHGSLVTNGHHYEGHVVELSIPAPSLSHVLSQLPVAVALGPWMDLSGGTYQTFTDGESKRYGDVLPLPGRKRLSSYFDSYGADGRDLYSVGIWEAVVGFRGLYHFGPRPNSGDPTLNPFHYSRSTGGLALAPAWFAAALGGYDLVCVGGWRRGGGTCGSPQGPSLVGARLSGILAGAPGPVSSIKLADWPKGGPPVAGYSICSAPVGDLCSSTTFGDVAFVELGDRSAVVVIGNICPSTSHYYDPSGTGGPPDSGPCHESKGQVCDAPYRAELWFFDPAVLIEVGRGQRAESSVAPYERLDLSPWLVVPRCLAGAGGLAWDGAGHRLFFVQQGCDSSRNVWDPGCLFYEVEVGP